MKKVLVHPRDSGRDVASEPMPDEDAVREKARIEDEIANAGTANTIIRVGQTASVQSKDILFLEMIDYVSAADVLSGGDDHEPFFTRDMKF